MLTRDKVNERGHRFTLTDLNGKQISLQELKDKVVVLDFWQPGAAYVRHRSRLC